MRNIVKFCADECRRQNASPEEVFLMFRAWEEAVADRALNERRLTPETILMLGCLVDGRSMKGYRDSEMKIGQPRGVHPLAIAEAIVDLCRDHQPKEDPRHFWASFMQIRPFEHGSGRVGSLLFNWENLGSPKPTPFVWN